MGKQKWAWEWFCNKDWSKHIELNWSKIPFLCLGRRDYRSLNISCNVNSSKIKKIYMLKLWSKFIGRYINSINLSVIKNVPKITITSSYTFYLLDDFIILNCIEKIKWLMFTISLHHPNPIKSFPNLNLFTVNGEGKYLHYYDMQWWKRLTRDMKRLRMSW